MLCLEIRRKESDPAAAAAASQATTTTTTIIIIATCVATKVKVRAFVAPAAAALVVVVVVVLLQEQAAPCRANDTDTRTRIIGPAGGSACRCSALPSSLRSAAAAAELPPPWAIPVHSRSTTCSYWMRSPGAAAPVTMARTASWRCYPEVLPPSPTYTPTTPSLSVRAAKLMSIILWCLCSDPAIVPLPWPQIRVRPVHLVRLGRRQATGSLLRRHDLVMLCGQRPRRRGKSARGAGQQHK